MKNPLQLSALILLLLIGRATAAESTQAAPETKALDYAIVVTGGELLEGAYPDAHTHFLTRTLRPLGCRCVSSVIVDDQREDMFQALRFAEQRAPLVIITGGLGPTPNDITRETLAAFTGIGLREEPQVIAMLEKRFGQSREQLRPNVRRQALMPQQGGFLKNLAGTAVGLIFDAKPAVIVALPGPPRELQPMVKNELVPYLQRRYGVHALGASLTLRFVGAGQSLIDQTIKDHLHLAPDVVVTSLFEGGRVDFTFTLPGHTVEDQARLKRLEQELAQHLGEYIYADDGSSLEEKVLQQLRRRAGSVVMVEIGSGGQLAVNLNAVPGAKELLKGAYLAPSEAQMCRLLQISDTASLQALSSVERIKQLAAAALQETSSEWAIAVGAVTMDDQQMPSVWIAFGPSHSAWITQRLPLRDTTEAGRAQLVTQILDRLRRPLQ